MDKNEPGPAVVSTEHHRYPPYRLRLQLPRSIRQRPTPSPPSLFLSTKIDPMSASATRSRVIGLYKELQRLGRDYPDPSSVPASPAAARPASTATRPFLTKFTDMTTKAGCAGYSKVRLGLLPERRFNAHTGRAE